ncbi:hypothetical protein [Haloarchaeobius amylolyticus]|nr:hypothetical protein [Haloarchaeobius amylolyticus]
MSCVNCSATDPTAFTLITHAEDRHTSVELTFCSGTCLRAWT